MKAKVSRYTGARSCEFIRHRQLTNAARIHKIFADFIIEAAKTIPLHVCSVCLSEAIKETLPLETDIENVR